ncbi:MAG TPA: trypsin-like peptidase domain-containing protein [Myxococcota bacterium]|nr:trypsin-like peptidase domain-containing protein [Myxococcota bacterium]
MRGFESSLWRRLACAAALAAFGVTPPPARADRESRRTPVVAAVEGATPATVNITSTQVVVDQANPFLRGDPMFDEFFRRFMNPRANTSQSLGTGVIINKDGFVLTNEHVLAGSTQIRVGLADGRQFDAELIGGDPASDLAVVRIKTKDPLPTPKLGNSDDVMIGESVIAIGNPFGLNSTVTTGVLSATNRSIRGDGREYHGFLQTDASINPGNSGGPLLNMDGEVIGINTAILGNAQGIGFAIPINRARRIVEDLIRHGEVQATWLGLWLQELTPALREAMGSDQATGVLVSNVFDAAPAAAAGVQRGDILTSLDGAPVHSRREFYEIARGITVGDHAKLALDRSGKKLSLEVAAERFPEARADELAQVLLGLELADRTPALAKQFSLRAERGLVVQRVVPRSAAEDRGLRPGDLILQLGQERVDDRVSLRKAIPRILGQDGVVVVVQRGRAIGSVMLELW